MRESGWAWVGSERSLVWKDLVCGSKERGAWILARQTASSGKGDGGAAILPLKRQQVVSGQRDYFI